MWSHLSKYQFCWLKIIRWFFKWVQCNFQMSLREFSDVFFCHSISNLKVAFNVACNLENISWKFWNPYVILALYLLHLLLTLYWITWVNLIFPSLDLSFDASFANLCLNLEQFKKTHFSSWCRLFFVIGSLLAKGMSAYLTVTANKYCL